MNMDTTLNALLAIVVADWIAVLALASSILGGIYLTVRYGWRYALPALILTGVALCRLALDVAGRPLILTQIGMAPAVLAVVAGLLLVVLGDIALWRVFAAPQPPKDFPPLFISVILPAMMLVTTHEPFDVLGFFGYADVVLAFAGLTAPMAIIFIQVMRAIRAAKRARATH